MSRRSHLKLTDLNLTVASPTATPPNLIDRQYFRLYGKLCGRVHILIRNSRTGGPNWTNVLSEMVLPTLRFQARNIHIVCTNPCPHGFDGPNVKESYGDLTTSRFWGRWPHNLGSRLNAKQNFEQLAWAASLCGLRVRLKPPMPMDSKSKREANQNYDIFEPKTL